MRHIFYITVFIIFFSCESKTKFKEPEDLISREQMIDLLIDLHIGVAAKNVKNKNLERDINYMVFVFEKYKIDSIRFQKSNIYYMSNIEEYEEMFEEVEAKLKILHDQYDLNKDTLNDIGKRIEEYERMSEKIRKGELVK